jgi:hypothetical protein
LICRNFIICLVCNLAGIGFKSANTGYPLVSGCVLNPLAMGMILDLQQIFNQSTDAARKRVCDTLRDIR